jgi:DNA polymerase-1
MNDPIGFDLETASADQLFLAPRGEFIKIAGYTDGDDVGFTTDMTDLMQRIRDAKWSYTHGGMTFDLLALAFHHASEPGEWWDSVAGRAVDTELLERLDNPPQARDTGGSDEKYNLDAVAERRGVPGKTADLRELAKKHGGYANIPNDDPEYRDYLAGDVNAIRALVGVMPNTPDRQGERFRYAAREHAMADLNGRMTLNGLRVDQRLLEERIDQGEERKQRALLALSEDFDLPLGRFGWKGRGNDKEEFWEKFTNPNTSVEGRKWMISVWDAFGVRNPPLTDTGQLSTKAEHLRPIAESPVTNPELRYILQLLMFVTSTRTVYQTVADHLEGDYVHPLIVMRQASGRSSVTSPGLTVFGKRGGRHIERDVFVPEDGHVFVSIDLSQVDMRAVAGHCQDPNYMKLFGFHPDGRPRDIHEENSILIFGTKDRRQDIKPINHGANYGLGTKKMIASGHDPDVVRKFFEMQRREFPGLIRWQNEIRKIAESGQLLDNGFGRLMRPDVARSYTQGPALMGQGTAAEILKQCGLRLGRQYRPYLKLPIHDEYLFSFPIDQVEELTEGARQAMTWNWKGVPILCDVSAPGKSWGEVSGK